MEAFNLPPDFEAEYVVVHPPGQPSFRVRQENIRSVNQLEAELLRDADFELYGDGYFDGAA